MVCPNQFVPNQPPAAAPEPPPSAAANLLRRGVGEWLPGLLAAHASEPIVYRRGGWEVTLAALPGRTRLLLSDEVGGVKVEYTDRDFVVRPADLVLAGVPTLPRREDVIEHTDGGLVTTYEVYPYNNEPPWQWSDDYRGMIRIRTKRLTSGPA